MAAASFTCLLLFVVSILSDPCYSCPEYSPCNAFTVRLPFYTDGDDPSCSQYLFVNCDAQSKPSIRLRPNDDSYTLQNISYDDNRLVIRDESLPRDLGDEDYLYNFTEPIDAIRARAHLKSPEASEHLSKCKQQDDHCLCDVFEGSAPCVNYGLFYSNATGSSRGIPPNCQVYEDKPFFEWELSFTRSGELFLLSAGLSHGYVNLSPDCFEHNAIGYSACMNCGKSHTKAIAIGIPAASSFLLICAALFFYTKRQILRGRFIDFHSESDNMQRIESFLKENGYMSPVRYRYSDLKRITKSFSEKIGHGGYGTVFIGTLQDGRLVAVKMLKSSEGDGEEFINEVASMGRTSHVNVVRLLGFCLEGQKRALVYEFMSNGSLDKFICSDEQRLRIGWKRLQDIAVGIARGLEYLHRGCNTRIVHFDIKPHNILLDDELCPKISDFGLAKLCSPKDSTISMLHARGTAGYIAPEVFCRTFGAVSTKSDVYSYGMMILEMTGATTNPSPGHDNSSEAYFPHWVYKQLEHDGDLQALGENWEPAKKLILVGLWCIQTMPANRPSIRKVIEMLEGKVDDIEHPPEPSYLSPPLLFVLNSSS